MDKVRAMNTLRHGLRAVSFVLLFKSVVGASVAALALFGVVVPFFGITPTPVTGGSAAAAGGVIGALLALRS
jgi:hypothetical protein